MNTKIKTIAIACGVVACGLSQVAQASPNLVVDGTFDTDALGQLGFNTSSAGWTQNGDANHSYDFILNGTSTSVGADGGISMANVVNSPQGGNYLGIDPVYTPSGGNQPAGVNWVSQTISGLSSGSTYTLSFYWAAAQQLGFSGTTTEGWNFSVGTSAGSVNNGAGLPSQTFAGWQTENFTFTASSTSELLKFVAEGGPSSGNPPFDLLDGVSITKNTVPDSSSTAGLLGLGVAAMGIAAGCRRFVRA
jgi:hypothetical protein